MFTAGNPEMPQDETGERGDWGPPTRVERNIAELFNFAMLLLAPSRGLALAWAAPERGRAQ